MDTPEVEVRRSRRRRRTVSAYREDGRTVVLIPARFTKAEERQWVSTMVHRLDAGDRRRSPSDAELTARAEELSRRHLGGLAKPASIRWVDNQQSRWGSCTPADGSIRISTRVRGMPGYVLDYVVLHELAHLIVPGHGKDFWSLVGGFPRTERARGYLEGVAAAAQLDLAQAGSGGEPEEARGQDGVAALEVDPPPGSAE
ncbi:M48 family metallopeptidase [Knoellia sp. 3-2P3]|uniref:M48 metallopeptidase family protein n=1 Tax=unclassified Knoellia TaxID=2618719 RepID=UPI0023DBBE12|nr:M48 family metallopeptidase [Knoellia sp. 3-2P3]MDF2093457.1 M48 family metallopeptidase [Knoellia sp. 3-2P3]